MTAANFYISRFYHHAVDCGLDADALFQKAGISPDVIDKPGCRIDTEKFATVLLQIWDALQDEAMGLARTKIPRGSFYMMGKLTIHEPDLRYALEQLIRFYAFVTDAYEMRLSVEDETASLIYTLESPEIDDEHLLAEIHLMSLHRYGSWLIAKNIPVTEFYFAYPAPPQVKEYSFLFPGKHVFDAPYMGFSFSKKFLDYATVPDSGALKSFMLRCPTELFMQPNTDFSLTNEVRVLLHKSMKCGFPAIEAVASHLNLARQTLIRKLREEGSSYQQIKDLIRRDRAIQLLTNHSSTVGEIAEKVSYSDPSVFARAFKSWTGLSPTEFRAKHSPQRAAVEKTPYNQLFRIMQ